MTPLEAARELEALDAVNLAEIKFRFRKLARTYHPDKNPAPDAHDRFVAISNAFEVLEAYAKDGGKLPLQHRDGTVEEAATHDSEAPAAKPGAVSVYAAATFEELMAALQTEHSVVHVVGGRAEVVNESPHPQKAKKPVTGFHLTREMGESHALRDVNRQRMGQILIYGDGLSAHVRRLLQRGHGSVGLPSNTCRREANGTCVYGACTARIEGNVAYVNNAPYVLIVMPDAKK